MFDGQRFARLIGETMREVGILVIVFVPLDAAFGPDRLGSVMLRGSVIGGFVLILAGIIMESKR